MSESKSESFEDHVCRRTKSNEKYCLQCGRGFQASAAATITSFSIATITLIGVGLWGFYSVLLGSGQALTFMLFGGLIIAAGVFYYIAHTVISFISYGAEVRNRGFGVAMFFAAFGFTGIMWAALFFLAPIAGALGSSLTGT